MNNSPIQLIYQLKGYFKINPLLSVSLAITLFSFIGVPPLIGFFGKQMILSAALDNGYIFITFIAILTSVISAVYYLVIVKNIFFDNNEYKENSNLNNNNTLNISISSSLTNVIALITMIILLFILIPKEFFNLSNIISIMLYCY
jgi:NADH-ubiquinone oxidoreductase chain 2